jgi:hypothetical protein
VGWREVALQDDVITWICSKLELISSPSFSPGSLSSGDNFQRKYLKNLFQKVPEAKKKGETVKRKVLQLSENKNGSAYIKELREIQVIT